MAVVIAKQQSHDLQKPKRGTYELQKLPEERHAPSTGNAKLLWDKLGLLVLILQLWESLTEKEVDKGVKGEKRS